jgi:hypothetical protein
VLSADTLPPSFERFGCSDCRNACASCRHCIASLISISRCLGLSVCSAARAHSSAWRSYNRALIGTARSTGWMKPDTLHHSLTHPFVAAGCHRVHMGRRLSIASRARFAPSAHVASAELMQRDHLNKRSRWQKGSWMAQWGVRWQLWQNLRGTREGLSARCWKNRRSQPSQAVARTGGAGMRRRCVEPARRTKTGRTGRIRTHTPHGFEPGPARSHDRVAAAGAGLRWS